MHLSKRAALWRLRLGFKSRPRPLILKLFVDLSSKIILFLKRRIFISLSASAKKRPALPPPSQVRGKTALPARETAVNIETSTFNSRQLSPKSNELAETDGRTLANLPLLFTKGQLSHYVDSRSFGLAEKSRVFCYFFHLLAFKP